MPTVAIAVLPLLHTPPDVASEKVTEEPTHTRAVPVIAASVGVIATVICITDLVPQPVLYVIFTVPLDTPVTMPVAEPTVARAVLLLVHVP